MTDKLFLGDTPEQLNVKCANWVDVLVIDGKAYTAQDVENLLIKNKSLNSQLKSLINSATEAAKLLGFLSYHLRGRMGEMALLDMAEKADNLIEVLKKVEGSKNGS